MSLKDALQSQIKDECIVGQIMQDLSPEDAEALKEALGNPKHKNIGIARSLTSVGYPISDQSVARHKGRECKCYKNVEKVN